MKPLLCAAAFIFLQSFTSPKTNQDAVKKYYYKHSKKLSAVVTPWKDHKRTVTLYDSSGNVTYKFDDVFESYQNTTEIKSFHPNGAVNIIEHHMNPGASMYWYESDYAFDEKNIPLSSPLESLLQHFRKNPCYVSLNTSYHYYCSFHPALNKATIRKRSASLLHKSKH